MPFRPDKIDAVILDTGYTVTGSSAAVRVTEMTVMSSSWPKLCAASAIDSAEPVATAAVRSKPKSSPDLLRASTTPSVTRVSCSFWASWKWDSGYVVAASIPSGRPLSTRSSLPLT